MHLHLLQINRTRADTQSKLMSITSTVVTVRGRKVVVFWPVLLKERVGGEVGGVASGGEDDGSVSSFGLVLVFVLDADDGAVRIFDELRYAGFLHDFDTVGGRDGEVLEALHLGVCDHLRYGKRCAVGSSVSVGIMRSGRAQRTESRRSEGMKETYHSWELSITTVGTRLTMATETGDLGEVKAELVLKPIDGVTRAASEDCDEVITSKFASLSSSSAHIQVVG